jgi:uncharacterized protein
MTIPQIITLFIAAMLGGTLNSVAGGGSFFSFPALYFTGVLPVQANATSTVALWPASAASAGAYWRELTQVKRGLLFLLVGTSIIGGVIGAILLIYTPQSIFVQLLPYLLLLATLLFTFSKSITARLHIASIEKTRLSWPKLTASAAAQLVIAIYGGYFGGGIGILMLAGLALMGMEDMLVMNALKNALASCINGVAIIVFIFLHAVAWPQAIVMILGSTVGGFGASYYARKIDQKWIRLFVMVVGFSLTIWFFIHH